MSNALTLSPSPCCDPAPGAGLLTSGDERRLLAMRLVIALVVAGLLVLALVLRLLGPGAAELGALVAAAAAVLIAIPVLRDAWLALRSPDLHGVSDLLVATAMIAAWVVGDLETAALVPLAMVISHVLEERSLLGSREAVEALTRLTRTQARRLEPGGAVTTVEAEALAVGDRIEVRPGDRFAADGVVRDGTSAVDLAPITGESLPVDVAPGDGVVSGTINQDGRLVVEVTAVGGNTRLGRVVAAMREAERAKPPITRLLERFAGRYLALMLLLGCGVLFLTGSSAAMMAVLVAACPCALVLAAPATAVASLAVAARHGILVKGTAFLEELAHTDRILLDKTGTLTRGQLALTGSAPADGWDPTELVRLAGSLGAASSHPVSRSLARAVTDGERLPTSEVQEAGGRGVHGLVAGNRRVVIGRAPFVSEHLGGATLPPVPDHDGPAVAVAVDGAFAGWLLLADEIRPEAPAVLAALAALGLRRQVLVTGDRRAVAERVATTLGITEVHAEVLPEDKLARVLAETAAGGRPLVVGDGVNDALALKAGAVGVAIGGRSGPVGDGHDATEAALASSDVVLMTGDLTRLPTCIRLARACRRTILGNVAIGLGWTALTIAGAIAGLYGPVAAVLIHTAGTLVVLANAGRLLRFEEHTAEVHP